LGFSDGILRDRFKQEATLCFFLGMGIVDEILFFSLKGLLRPFDRLLLLFFGLSDSYADIFLSK
jgi:hypothetical protein